MNLNELRDEAYATAKANGWHEEKHSDEHYLMLIITEIAEAVQADRKGHHARVDKFIDDMADKDNEDCDTWFRVAFAQSIGNTVEDELADIVIRCLDLAGLRGYDLQNLLDTPADSKEIEETFGGKTFAEIAFGICGDIFFSTAEAAVYRIICDVVRYCRRDGIDLDFFIRAKMRYNRLRGYKHGGKRY